MQRYTFPPAGDAYLIVDTHHHNDGATRGGGFTQTGPEEISGFTQTDHYPVFFAARFDRPIAGHGDTWVRFAPGQTVTMRVGISFVDADGARRNLDAEAPAGVSFEDMRSAAHVAWGRELGRLRVAGGTIADRRTFYTALYHALLHPNVFTDVDGRYRGFDGAIHDAGGRTQYANFSSWDTYKAENQLEAMLEPGRYADMLRSLLADAQQGGRLPRWGEEDYDAAHMSGDPAIPMIADGYCRGLLGDSDARQLYDQAARLVGLRQPEYAALGYLPVDRYNSGTGTTLEYGVADFSLALMADGLGRPAEAARWLASSLSYRNELDPGTRWIRPRNSDGSWYANFDPAHDETGFQEGNSWQYSWLVPQDPRGLFDRMGGDAAAVARLDHLFAAPAEAQTKATFFGTLYRVDQWAPGNEHDLGAPFLYAFAGEPYKTQAELRAAQLVYRPTMDGLPGNDDLGGLSSWYVLSAIGISPFTPGAPLYMVGSPLFGQARIARPGGRPFVIDAPGASLAGRYVQSASLDGRPLRRAWFADRALRGGGRLRLQMGATPNTSFGAGAGAVPPSASDAPLSAFGCHPAR
jgi:predicted alpha-1,2-mannosidase